MILDGVVPADPLYVWSGLLEREAGAGIDVYEEEAGGDATPLLLDSSGKWLPRAHPKTTKLPRIGFLPWMPEET